MDQFAQGAGGPAGASAGRPGGGNGQDVTAIIGQIRNLGSQADQLGQAFPPLQQEIQQIRAIIKRMIVKAGQGGSGQNASAEQLPMGG